MAGCKRTKFSDDDNGWVIALVVLAAFVVLCVAVEVGRAQESEPSFRIFEAAPQADVPAGEPQFQIFGESPDQDAEPDFRMFESPDQRDAQIDKILKLLDVQSQRLDALGKSLEASRGSVIPDLPEVWIHVPTWHCQHCIAQTRAILGAKNLPFQPVFKRVGGLKSYPQTTWVGRDGKPRWHMGWKNLPALLQDWQASMGISPQAAAAPQASARSWQQISVSPGPYYYEGTPRQSFPTTRQHLANEHKIPLSETWDMTQPQLDRLHGFKHTGTSMQSRGPVVAQTLAYRQRAVGAALAHPAGSFERRISDRVVELKAAGHRRIARQIIREQGIAAWNWAAIFRILRIVASVLGMLLLL